MYNFKKNSYCFPKPQLRTKTSLQKAVLNLGKKPTIYYTVPWVLKSLHPEPNLNMFSCVHIKLHEAV